MRRLIYLVPLVVITILVLQKTKQALLPRQQTPLLWGAAIVTVAGVVLLQSGLASGRQWRNAQAALGTVANNFYEPRRAALVNGFAIAGGVFGGLWWGAVTWGVVMNGMRRGVVGRGLFDFEISVLVGALTGGTIGAVTGLAIGHIWEARHRRRRA